MAKIIDSLQTTGVDFNNGYGANTNQNRVWIPNRPGSDLVTYSTTGTGSFTDFQSFTVDANTLTSVGDCVVYAGKGEYEDESSLRCVFGSTNVFTVSIAAPSSGTQAYELTWETYRLSSTQANSWLTISGGSGIDAFAISLFSIISTIDWTSPIVIKTQGSSDINPSTIFGTQAQYFIK